jgi:D-alanyl-D-alanine endopeptidase (penicillin-binding protein 7)
MQINNLIKAQGDQIKVLYLATLVLLLPIFAGVYFLYVQDSKSGEVIVEPEVTTPISIHLDAVQTTAHSAIVVSLNTNTILYQKNPNKSLPLASLTKLITAKIAKEDLQGDTVAINKMQELSQYGDARLLEGERWNKNELIDYTLTTSSNDGAHSLSTNSKNIFSFTDNMNDLVASIGLVDTHFYNETGLDNDNTGTPGSKGTAQDVSKILSYLIKNDLSLYEKTKHGTITVSTPEGMQTAANTNEVAERITGLLVSKTGYTDLAGGNLAVVADMGLNEPTAFVVLKSSRESRFDDVLKLQNEYFAQARERMR